MNKIRVIDLLNKIANGEEVPKTLKYKSTIYEAKFNISCEKSYYIDDKNSLLLEEINNATQLNDEVEIIEVPKKIPKKLKCKYTSQIGKIELAKTINEIIDYLESKGDE